MNPTDPFSEIGARIGGFIDEHTTRPASDADFNRLALDLFALQFQHNGPFQRLCRARGAEPDCVDHWTRIPAMPAAAFKEWEVTSLPADRRSRVFHSSGTTEQTPSRHWHDDESLALYESSLKPGFARAVLGGETRVRHQIGLLTPSEEDAPNSSLVHMFAVVKETFGDPDSTWLGATGEDRAWIPDPARLATFLERSVVEELPVILLGTAFLFVHLLDLLEGTDHRFTLPAGSKVMETGGYKGRSREMPREELHRLIGYRLGVGPERIVREYGMSELSSQAYANAQPSGPPPPAEGGEASLSQLSTSDSPARRSPAKAAQLFHFPPWARARIVSPETGAEVAEGETGLIQIHDLANLRSVATIRTEDLGIRRGEGFELLGRSAQAEPRGCSRMTN